MAIKPVLRYSDVHTCNNCCQGIGSVLGVLGDPLVLFTCFLFEGLFGLFWGFGVVAAAAAAVLGSRSLHVAQLSWKSLHTPAWPWISAVLPPQSPEREGCGSQPQGLA